jgi:DNA-binding transcriptional LysR family regulator
VPGEIELRQIRYFLAIAEERSFTRAARRCNVAQPSLSRQIRALENSLGTRVFERLPREIRITPAGKVFEREASQVMEHSQRAISVVQSLERAKRQQLKLGLSVLCDLPRMQSLLQKAQKSTPEFSIECTQAHTADLSLGLLRGKLDLAVVDLPVVEPGVSTLPIHSESLIAALPERHLLHARPMVRIFELKKERIVLLSCDADPGTALIEAALQQAGVSAWHAASSQVEMLDHVAVEHSVGLMRVSAGRLRREGVISKPFANSIRLETAIAWRTEDRNPRMVSFRDALIAFSQRQPTA